MTTSWPRVRAAVGDRAVLKACCEDFRVVEMPAMDPTGDGEHLYLHLEKTGLSTPELAARLASEFDVPPVAVGYAGMKDKRAVTSQWFSVHTPHDATRLPAWDPVRVLASTRHQRKLRRGDLAGNRFAVRLRDVSGPAWADALATVQRDGVPNYFGPQRFGSDNLAQARSWLPERRRRRLPAFRSGLYLSVLRSYLFNEVLAARVRGGCWDRLLPGDAALPAAQSPDAGEVESVPTGPLWGRGRPAPSGEALAIEVAALAPHADICDGLEHAGLQQERRALVLRAPDLAWHIEGRELLLNFTLPPGTYATVLLGAVFELDEIRGTDAPV